jgi:hypothetical protein
VYRDNDGNGTFSIPADDAKTVWRYLSFSRFVSVLQTGQIFLVRLENLEDPYEGRFTVATECRFPRPVIGASEQYSRHNLCVSCWHTNEYESAAMWAIYSGQRGVAIRSTIGRIKKSLHKESRDVFICEVQYVDFSQFDGCDNYFSLNLKRKSFEHENEVRLWVHETDHTEGQKCGTKINVDLEELIDQVYISPKAESWLKDLVDRERVTYHLNRGAIQSALYAPIVR